MTASGTSDEETPPIVTHDHQAELPSAASGARWGRSFHSLAIIMTAPSALAKYQGLIDTLVERNECVLARRIREGDLWPEQASNSKFNGFVATLTQEQRNLLAELLQSARNGGIHDVLVVLSEKMNLENLKLVLGGEEIPNEPYGTEIYYDWVARSAGDNWPENAG